MKIKTEFIGILLLVCAFILMSKTNKFVTDEHSLSPSQSDVKISQDVKNSIGVSTSSDVMSSTDIPQSSASPDCKIFTLQNDVIAVNISDIGGSIKSVELKKYHAQQDKPELVTFNSESDTNALEVRTDNVSFSENIKSEKFEVSNFSDTEITLSKNIGNEFFLTRKYSISAKDSKQEDGYSINHELRIKNTSDKAVKLGNMSLFLGVMPTTASDTTGDYMNFGAFNGKKDFFVKLKDFKSSNGFFGLGKRSARQTIFSNEKILWGSIKNQFFTSIFDPIKPADAYVTYPISLNDKILNIRKDGIAASLIFQIGYLEANEEYELSSNFYVGPKDFSRLSALRNEQDRVMQFGFFGSISELLLRLMLKIHSIIPNWGWTIIALTTIVKLVLWPLTNAQVRSSKKMSAIQQPLKLLKEKFKNNPQKLQAETLKLFKENQINPAAGCLPIFIQIPIFFGLYYMLRTSSDLRFAHFLWVKDLSLPDTITHFGNFPINILPLIMGITMFYQMHITPMPTSDSSQKLMFKIMPVIFLLCCYNFPSGLVLYWTVQNLLTILQQFISSRSVGVNLDLVKTTEIASENVKKVTNVKKSERFINQKKRRK